MIKSNFNNISKAISEFRPRNVKEVKVGSFTPERNNIKPFQTLDRDVYEFSSTKNDIIASEENFDIFDYLGTDYDDLNEHIQYSIDDVPLAECLRPIKKAVRQYTSNINSDFNTDLSKDSIKTLRRIQYYDVIHNIAGKDADTDDIKMMSAVAADLSFRKPESYVSELIPKSVLKRKGKLPNKPSAGLLEFLSKHPTKRNLVVNNYKDGEHFDKHAAYHVDKMLKVTNNVEDIKKSLKECKLHDVVQKEADYHLTGLAVDIMNKNKSWGVPESDLLNTVKVVNNSHITIDRNKIKEIKNLLTTDMTTDEIFIKVAADSK